MCKRPKVSDEMDVTPIQVKGGNLDIVDHFQYLGSNISRDGEVTVEIVYRIAQASRAFGCLRKPIYIPGQEPLYSNQKTGVQSSRTISLALRSR